jgi:hypothetical protein
MGVPFLPGVPPLAAYSGSPLLATTLLTSDGPGVPNNQVAPQWGIFLGGAPVVVADNVVSLTYKQEWAIADYPVEEGAFETYDKVQIPFEARVRFSAGGSEANRQALLDSIAAIAGDNQTRYTVVTPEETYPSVTIAHYDYSRTATNGVGLIQVDVWCLNIMVNTTANFQSTAAPSGASPINDGTVQATTAPAAPSSSGPPEFPGSP